MIKSDDLEFFITVASCHSLAESARKLNITPPRVTQKLQELEDRLGVSLVNRSSRKFVITDAGRLMVEQGEACLIGLENLQASLLENQEAISGEIKLVSSVAFGVRHIADIVAKFQETYSDIRFDLVLSDAPSWGGTNDPDIIFYIGTLHDSSLKRVVLAKNQRLLLASPDYLESSLPISSPQDLTAHKCIVLRENNDDATLWPFTNSQTGKVENVRVRPSLSSNLGQVTKNWCVQGKGLIQRSEWDVREELKQNRLVQVLPNYTMSEADIVALLPSDPAKRSTKIQIFMEFVMERLQQRLARG